jgi:hypothetical protein
MRPGAAPAATGPPRRQFILPLEDAACETSINNILTGMSMEDLGLLRRPELLCACVGIGLRVWVQQEGQLINCSFAQPVGWA